MSGLFWGAVLGVWCPFWGHVALILWYSPHFVIHPFYGIWCLYWRIFSPFWSLVFLIPGLVPSSLPLFERLWGQWRFDLNSSKHVGINWNVDCPTMGLIGRYNSDWMSSVSNLKTKQKLLWFLIKFCFDPLVTLICLINDVSLPL